jgi:hypothetical protein
MRFAFAAVIALAACAPQPMWHAPAARPQSHHLTQAEMDAIPTAFPTTLVRPRSNVIASMYSRLVELKNPELVGQLVSTLISLGRLRVPVTVEQCDDVKAQYDTRSNRILICYEFIANANRLAGKPKSEWYTLDKDAATMLIFTALHEISHALVDVLRLRPGGNEEDLADQFAFLMMTNVKDAEMMQRLIAVPAAFFHEHGKEVAREGGHAKGDVHSSSASRAFEAMCMLYGRQRDPTLGRALGADGPRCIAHTREVIAKWNRLLRPYTRLDTGNTFSMD